MKKITKAVIPAAGYGTRFLPATKSLPKEMFPIIDKPTLQFIIEEAVNSGITDILIIISINGNTFHFEKGVIQNILNCSVNTWLISCKKNIDFSDKILQEIYISNEKDKMSIYTDLL